jgi:hypothetical protein
MMATVTGHGGAGDVVWQTPGVVAMLRAGADSEARTEATGRGRARAGVAGWHGHVLGWACRASPWPVVCTSRVSGVRATSRTW